MGMFDTVVFNCPSCDSELEVQSKAGDCTLDTYKSSNVDIAIAANIVGELLTCEKCDIDYRICGNVQQTVKLYLIDDEEDNRDYNDEPELNTER